MYKFIKDLLSTPSSVVFFGVIALAFIFPKRKTREIKSDTPSVDDAIHQLDVAINKFGTDEQAIFDVFERLSKSEIIKLYKDFGIRYYNTITGEYIVLDILSGAGLSKPFNLQGLLTHELNSKEVQKLKDIHVKKGIRFPYISN